MTLLQHSSVRRQIPRSLHVLLALSLAALLAAAGVVASGAIGERPCKFGGAPTTTSRALPHAAPAAARPDARVLLVMLENREFCQVLSAQTAPYLHGLAREYGLSMRQYGSRHPSLPNYINLLAGSSLGITRNCSQCKATPRPTLVDELEQADIPWQAYIESWPGGCFRGAAARGGYVKKHNPFLYLPSVLSDPHVCDKIVNSARLLPDLAADRFRFGWLTPNLCHQGHDCGTRTVDAWLGRFVRAVQATPWYDRGGSIILTWDEGISDAGCCQHRATGGHIPTLVISEAARGLRVTQPVSHAGTLRTIEELYGLPLLGDARCSCSGDLLALFPTAR